ncbi:hypothetical protein BBD46_16720 [Natrialba sp. SSL1]|nr:hypothetical protein BBD46_16720 [Natrialba sp. SSL1]
MISEINKKVGDRIEREKEQKRKEIKEKKRKTGGVTVDDVKTEVKLPYTDGGVVSYSKLSDDEKAKVVEKAFDKHIQDKESVDGTLFRFLIRRMGYLNSYYAVPYCMKRIENGGPDIRRILDKYFSNLDNKESLAGKMMEMILSGDVPYEYHEFAIVRWIFQAGIRSKEIIGGMRELLNRDYEIREIKNYIISYLGEHGEAIDIKAIFDRYPRTSNDVRKSIILMGIRNMESGMRATIYNQAKTDHQYCEFSIDLAKEKA